MNLEKNPACLAFRYKVFLEGLNTQNIFKRKMQSVCFYLDKYITYIFCQFLSKLATSEQRFKNISTIKKILIKLIITLLFVNKTGSLMIKQKWQQKFIKASNTHFHNDYLKGYIEHKFKYRTGRCTQTYHESFHPPSFHSAPGRT